VRKNRDREKMGKRRKRGEEAREKARERKVSWHSGARV